MSDFDASARRGRNRLLALAAVTVVVVACLGAVTAAQGRAAAPPSFCGPPTCESGGCTYTVTLYFADYSYVNNPASYVNDPPNGCWNYARLNPSDTPAYGTKCTYASGISAGGSHLYFDDTNLKNQVLSTLQSKVQTCANYGSSNFGDGKIEAEFMAPYPWTKVAPTQGVAHYLAELYSSDLNDVESYFGDWSPSSSGAGINLSPYVPFSTSGASGNAGTNFNTIVNDVWALCQDTPADGALFVYDAGNYPLANRNNSSDPQSAEAAVIEGMNNCDPS